LRAAAHNCSITPVAMMNAAGVMDLPGIGAPRAIADEGIARPVVLAIGIGIELGAPAGIVDHGLG